MRTYAHSSKQHESLYGALRPKYEEVASGCWEWTHCLNYRGYGQLTFQQKRYLAHRAMWEVVHGGIPDGLLVLHKCDNRKCINPRHLFVGTAADNTQDMMRKGRHISPRKSACKRAHPLEGENLYISPSGQRACRECQKQRELKHRRKHAVT